MSYAAYMDSVVDRARRAFEQSYGHEPNELELSNWLTSNREQSAVVWFNASEDERARIALIAETRGRAAEKAVVCFRDACEADDTQDCIAMALLSIAASLLVRSDA